MTQLPVSFIKKIGNYGECVVLRYLERQGYRLIAKNWQYHRYELDLVAVRGSELLIGEVKTHIRGRIERPFFPFTSLLSLRILATTKAVYNCLWPLMMPLNTSSTCFSDEMSLLNGRFTSEKLASLYKASSDFIHFQQLSLIRSGIRVVKFYGFLVVGFPTLRYPKVLSITLDLDSSALEERYLRGNNDDTDAEIDTVSPLARNKKGK
jgi:Holliday junction resolvase-like predicted endonuclease